MNKILSVFIALIFSANVFADDMAGASSTKVNDVDVDFTKETFNEKPWTKEFRYVLVVNKAAKGKDAQTLKVYEYGELIRTSKVSTGREQFEKKGQNGSKNDFWTTTPTGFYTPSFLNKDHKSSAYGGKLSWLIGGTPMPYAIFFNGGIAFHEVPSKAVGKLGKRASGGCIRLPFDLASDLFYRVKETSGAKNPRFTVDGQAILDKDGNQAYATKSGFGTLVVVINKEIQ